MELRKFFEGSLDGDNTILCASMLNNYEVVILLSNGDIYRWHYIEKTFNYLFSVSEHPAIHYKDGGFDLNSSYAIYTMDPIVVVVNDRQIHGCFYNPKFGGRIRIQREDYYAQHSPFPIALYRDDQNVPHLIYAEAWNHLQVMNLDTLQILTADKSLMEVGAEERYMESYQKYPDRNYIPWPGRYDYFFAQILMSPDNKKFISRGWSWGSSDDFKIFDLDHFLNSNRISSRHVWGGEHLNRPLCWIDNETFASTYYPYRDESASSKSTAIHFCSIENPVQLLKEFVLHDTEEVYGELYYNKDQHRLISIDKAFGTTVFDTDGNALFKDELFKPLEYNAAFGLFVHLDTDKKSISLFKLI